MRGPINFVFTVLWIAIGLATIGTLKQCTLVMAGYAVESQSQQLSLVNWNKKLNDK